MIQLEHVSKWYGSRAAVEDLTFSVAEGEVVGFLGPNGAGKTTTMRMITGYMPPSDGHLTVAGFDPIEEPFEVKQRIGYLPENPPLYADMTVTDYLYFVSELKRVPRERRRAQVGQALERTGLTGVSNRLIGHLSRGYRQRVGLAQALIGEPPVLILDEPTVGLDPQQIIEIRQLIKELAGSHTVLLSSHILPEVQAICERVIIINKGRLVAQDEPARLAERLRTGTEFRLRVQGPADRAQQLLRGIAGVRSVEIDRKPESQGTGQARAAGEALQLVLEPGLETGESENVRAQIFFTLAEARIPIVELSPVRVSLEDVFLQLVTEEQPHHDAHVTSQGGAER
ncbi:MAG: ABC transporter ATP-binding protein [Limnochordales bacterium]|nr:ABC transporter ATP-binding protein [Limnochordales bacterium]